MLRIILITLFVFCSSSSWSSKFSLDKFDIEINSNFLGEEIVLFGHKDEGRDLIIIFEGIEKPGKLFTKTKKGLLWINEKQELDRIPSFFGIFSTPKYSLNEIVSGDSIFCATGITSGDLVSGIQSDDKRFTSETLVTHKNSNFKQKVKKEFNI